MGKKIRQLGRAIDKKITQPILRTVEAVVSDPKKLLAVGLAVAFPGAGAALGAQLGLTGAAAQVVGQTLLNTALNGGDVKSAVLSAAIPVMGGPAAEQISKTISDAGIDGALNKVVTNAATKGLTAAVLNQDIGDALVLSLVQSAPTVVSQYVPQFAELPRAVQEAAIATTADLLRTGGNNLESIALSGVANAATDYAVKNIQGYDELRPGQKEVVRTGVSNLLQGKSVSEELLNGAMSFGQEAVQNEINENKAKDAGWADYKTQQAAKSMYGSKVTPDLYADKQETTEAEAKDIARALLGREPTEFEYMQLIGLPEGEAAQNSDLKAIQYDESTFDSGELAEAYKAVYGKEPTEEWLASEEAMDMLGRSDVQGKNMLQTAYTNEQNEIIKDKNWVTEDEAKQFWKDMGNTGPVPQEFMDNMLMTTESGAKAMSETYRIVRDDINATTFDGSKFKDQASAQTAAIKDGYNAYNWGDKTYYLMSQEQATQLQKDIAEGKTAGARPDAFFTLGPGATLAEQLAAAGNPSEYAYQQGDVITVVGKRMEVPEYEDLEAWKAFKDEKQAAGGDNFQSFLTEQFSILQQAMKGAPEDSIAKVMADAAMFGYGKMAQLVEAFSRTGEAMGVPQAERGTNIAKQVQSWSKKLVDQGVQNAEAAVLANVASVTKESIAAEKGVKPADISTAELYAQKTAALFKQVPNNPLGVSLFLVGEGIQEIPLLAVSGGVGSVFKNVIGKSVGLSAAVGTNVALNGAESFGGNYGEVKEYLAKQGVPASQIEALAVKSGLEGMAVGMLTSYVGDRALVKSFMGDLATDSFGKVVATNSAKEWFLGNFEGSLQNMSAQIGKYGSIKSEDEWLNAGIMEGFAQKGIAAGVLTAASLEQAVAKDYDGKPVTYKEVIEGTKTFDPKTLDKNFSFGNGVNLGDAIGYHSTFITNPDITPDEYFYAAQTFRENGMNDFTPQEIASIVGTPGEMSSDQILEVAKPYAQERVVTQEEAQQMMRDLGYTNFTDAEATSLAGQISEADARARVQEYVAPRQVTRDEAADFFASIPGYTPTEEEINSFIRQGANVNQAAVQAELGQYVAPRLVTEEEVRAAYAELGLDSPTQADIDKMVGQYNQDLLAGKVDENLGTAQYNSLRDQMVTKQDIKDAIAGIQIPAGLTRDDVGSAISEYMKVNPNVTAADVAEVISEYMTANPGLTKTDLENAVTAATKDFATTKDIEAAIAGIEFPAGLSKEDVVFAIADYMAANPGLNAADVTKSITDYMTANPGLTTTDLNTAISEATKDLATTAQLTDLESSLAAEIQAAIDIGLEGNAAVQAGLNSLAEKVGINQADLLAQLGTTEEALRTEFATGISGLEMQMQEQYDALTTAQRETADALVAQGKTLADAIAEAQETTSGQISDLEAQTTEQYNTLTAAQKETADALVEQGKTLAEAVETARTEAAEQLTGAETRLNDAIAAAEAAGLSRDEAITSALASVATDLGTTKEALLTQLGKTEETLRSEFATGLAGVSAEVQAAYDSLSAEQKALATQLTNQGSTLAEAIEAVRTETASQIGTLSADMQAKYDALTDGQKALANDMAQQGLDLTAAINLAAQQTQEQITGLGEQVDLRIDELMQQGQTYQQATQQAIGELNTQNKQLQGLVGNQGRSANQSDIDALTEMLGGQRATDLTYDVTGDKQITQADIDFLTGVVGGTNTDWKAPVGSAWGATGLYGQLATNEAQRQADLQAQLAREEAAKQAAIEADRQGKIANIKSTAARGGEGIQALRQQLPKAFETTSTPLYGTMEYFDPFGDPFADPFGTPKMRTASSTNPADQTKMAAGGYIDDLLAGEMTVDDLLNLLR